MTHLRTPIFAALLLTSGCVALDSNPAHAQSIFPDANLEKAVRKQVFAKRFNDEPIVADDVQRISQVIGRDLEITNLSGLEHCRDLMLIDLSTNSISDLEPLAKLTKLQSVDLSHNAIESIEALAMLTKIQYLKVSHNRIENIEVMSKLKNCHSLYLSNNKIRSLSPIQSLTKLWSLYVSGNPIESPEPISKLTRLKSLDVADCGIDRLEFLGPLKELNYLNLEDNKITDLDGFVEFLQSDDESRFAPFLRVYLGGNELSKKSIERDIPAAKNMGTRIHLSDEE
jgi:hypothetical protein